MTDRLYIPVAFLVDDAVQEQVVPALDANGFDVREERLIWSPEALEEFPGFQRYADQVYAEWDERGGTRSETTVVIAFICSTGDEDWVDVDLADAVSFSYFTCPADTR